MKKSSILAGMLALLCLAPVWAKAEQVGVYVAPKFVYGGANMHDAKFKGSSFGNAGWGSFAESWSRDVSSGSDSVFGGSIALGYDFHKRFNVPVRAEAEYSLFSEGKVTGSRSSAYTSGGGVGSEHDSLKMRYNIQTLFFNSYFDFHTGTAFTPYLGAGLGMAFINAKAKNEASTFWPGGEGECSAVSTGATTRTNLAWNAGAGVAYSFTENFALDLGYRFAGLGYVKTKTGNGAGWMSSGGGGEPVYRNLSGESTLYMHQVSLGARVTF